MRAVTPYIIPEVYKTRKRRQLKIAFLIVICLFLSIIFYNLKGSITNSARKIVSKLSSISITKPDYFSKKPITTKTLPLTKTLPPSTDKSYNPQLPTQKDKEEVENLAYRRKKAKEHSDLKEIRNNIRVETPPQEEKIDIARFENDIQKALRNAGFGNIVLEVKEDFSVTLKGSVRSIEEKNKILQIARGIKGVKEIKDMIFVVE